MTEYTKSDWLDIGDGVSIELRYADGVLGGVEYRHPIPDGASSVNPLKRVGYCSGYVNIKGRPFAERWDLVSLEPLTLAPSLLCTACGHHGHIVNGKWVPA